MSNVQPKKRIPWNKGKKLPKKELDRRVYKRTQEYKKVHKDWYRKYQREYQQTLNGQYSVYKGNAVKRGLDFSLTKEQFNSFLGKACSYCGVGLNRVGIDRKDNLIGYVLENCVPCCAICNWMKRHLDADIFIEHCHQISKHNG